MTLELLTLINLLVEIQPAFPDYIAMKGDENIEIAIVKAYITCRYSGRVARLRTWL